MTTIKDLRKRAFLADALCIVLAASVLWAGSNLDVPEWLLITGAALAIVALIAAVVYSFKAHSLLKEQFKQRVEQAQQQASRHEEEAQQQ